MLNDLESSPSGKIQATAEQQLGFLIRDVFPLLSAVSIGYPYNPGDRDLDDEQTIYVRMSLGDYRRAVRIAYELRKR